MEILDQLCEPSGPGPNEDAIGHTGTDSNGAAWVIDGATGVAERQFIPGAASDAAWFAARLGTAFADLFDPTDSVTEQMRRAILQVSERYQSLVQDQDIPPYGLPSAAGVWVRWDTEGRLAYASLGDCRALIQPPDGRVVGLGPRRLDLGDALVNAAVRTVQGLGIRDPAAIRQRLTGRLRDSRARMNRPGGYWVFGIEPAAAEHCDLDQAQLVSGSRVLLISDGLFRLVDTYGAYSVDTLVSAAAADGLAPLYRVLREIEAADPDCRRHVRLKPGDDASAVLLHHR